MTQRCFGLALALSGLLALTVGAPTPLEAQTWYGWDNTCSTLGFHACASAQIRTVETSSGTRLLARVQNLSPVYWGGYIELQFSHAVTNSAIESWSGSGIFGRPTQPLETPDHLFGPDWTYFSFDLPFTVRETDLYAFYVEDVETIEVEDRDGDGFPHPVGRTLFYFQNPAYVAPEPVTMVLFGTGLAGIGAARLRRRKKAELKTDE